MQDTGEKDGVPRIFFGHGVASLWLHRILFLDAIYFLSQGKLACFANSRNNSFEVSMIFPRFLQVALLLVWIDTFK